MVAAIPPRRGEQDDGCARPLPVGNVDGMTTEANIRQVVDRPVVATSYGPVRGADDGRVTTWKGIRYAAAPVGDLRWRAPEPPQPWTEVPDATAFGPVSPQPRSPIPMGLGTRADEDCLFLNVWAPSECVDAGDAKPVMVWVHGGAYIFGSGSQPLYDGSVLAAGSDVIVVTINYRLGALGFIDFSSSARFRQQRRPARRAGGTALGAATTSPASAATRIG